MKRDTMGWVYFLETSDKRFIKIGYAQNDIKKRIQTLQTGNPGKLSVIKAVRATKRDEQFLINLFSKWRLPGSEWFHSNPKLRKFISGLKSKSFFSADKILL